MKKSTMSRLAGLGAVLATGLALSACGGDSDTPPVTAQVPATANASVDGYIAYVQALVVSDADMLEPVDVSGLTPPTSDTTEPTVIN